MIDIQTKVPTIYTAYSKYYFYAKEQISAFVLKKTYVPLNPFMNWNYFLGDQVKRELIVRGNNNLILRADEVWQFGPIADGCYHEILLAMQQGKPIKFFSVGKTVKDIRPLKIQDLEFEDELREKVDLGNFIIKLKTYLTSL